MIEIVPADSGKAFRQFIALPRVLYRDMPGYSPPLDMERTELLDPRKAAFFHHGEAAYFLAMTDGKPVGRISAQIDPHYQSRPGTADVGYFGGLDAVDDPQVTQTLLEAASAWLIQKGMKRVQGPFLLDFNGEPGLMVEGQSAPPMIMAPWHPAYLEDHLLRFGFSPIKDLYYYALDLQNDDLIKGEKTQRLLKKRPGQNVRSLRMDRLHEEAAITVQLYNDAWSGNWGFVPLEVSEIAGMLKTLKPLMHPDAGVFVEIDGEPAACTVVIPNVNAMVADLGGSPSLLGWLKLGVRFLRRDVTSARIILMGISERYRHTPMAAVLLLSMIHEIAQRHHRHNLNSVEAGWVLDDNTALIKVLEHFEIPRSRTYRLFEMAITGADH